MHFAAVPGQAYKRIPLKRVKDICHSRSMESRLVALFGLTSFLAAALLFSVQPLIGKMVLPVLGGTPAVWTTCLVYFQVMLLGGYLFAYGLSPNEGLKPRRIGTLYLCVLALLLAIGYALQPIAIGTEVSRSLLGGRNPAIILLGVLAVSATLPLLMVTATAPLLQCWFALTPHPRARDPYFLYAASNAGSLMALLAYPFLIEPALGLSLQSRLWRTGFLALAILVLGCGLTARQLCQTTADSSTHIATRVSARELIWWLVLVFIPAGWLMGVTTYLTTDLAAIPLLWVIPLIIYLLSFILAFARSGAAVVGVTSRLLPSVVTPLVLVMSAGFAHAVWIPLHLLAFFVACVTCHGALAKARPTAAQASTFYLTIAVGGLLGGVSTALLAPLVFKRVVEYPLAIILACAVAPGVEMRRHLATIREWQGDLLLPVIVFFLTAILVTNQVGLGESLLGVLGVMLASGLGLLACMTAGRRPMRFALTVAAVLLASSLSSGVSGRLIHVERSFFGVVRVTHDSELKVHRLFHGTTLHGQQSLEKALAHEPSTYFTRSGPIGQVFEWLRPHLNQSGLRVAILGLGAGTLASYARPGDEWTFYEIDPIVARIASDSRYFTYLQECRAATKEIVLGDARLRLREAPDGSFGLIVLDAFSSDSLPVHLLSREAIRLYRSKLVPGGVLAFNLSNRYLDLDPVLGRQAADAGLACRIGYDLVVSPEEKRAGKQPSIWAVVAESEDDFLELASDPCWRVPRQRPGASVWTDDYSNLLSCIRWRPVRTSRKSPER
jgi:hypothetical protein